MPKKMALSLWVSEDTKRLFMKKYHETKANNSEIKTMDDYVRYLLGYLIKEY